MGYTSQELVQDEMGGKRRLIEALDDDGTGDIDVPRLCRIIEKCSQTVDGYLQGRYVTPFNPVPAIVAEAALVFVMEKLYDRRKQAPDEKNPYLSRANEMRERLKAISDRKESLDATERPAFTPGAVAQRPSALQGSSL
jgi:phage gp36-like protein